MVLDFTICVSILLHSELVLDMLGLAVSIHLVVCLCICKLWLYLLYSGQISERNKIRLHVLTLNPLSGCIHFCIVSKMLVFCRNERVDVNGELRRLVVNFSFCIGSG